MAAFQATRRDLLRYSAAAGALTVFARPGDAATTAAVDLPADDPFVYEVQRSEDEWRSMLSEHEFKILRDGETEFPTSSDLWDDYRAGEFMCRGCNLHLYSSDDRAPIEMGYVFFFHSLPNTVLTDLDYARVYSGDPDDDRTLIEVHCRRCGSHLGHIVHMDPGIVHCINGTSLVFQPAVT